MERHRIWDQLPVELEQRIIGLLTPNETACTVRPLNKAAATRYKGPQHTTVRLSQPVPHHAFQRRFGPASGMWRILSYRSRIKVLCRTAVSGDTNNLDLAIRSAGCLVTKEVLAAAAGAGHLHVCQWLLQPDCGWQPSDIDEAATAAAWGGHPSLVRWLLRWFSLNQGLSLREALAAVRSGLAEMQRVYRQWWLRQAGVPIDISNPNRSGLLEAAAGSPTPDWRAKVEWLEAQGCPKTADACTRAARCPDAVDRLRWLRQRGYPVDAGAVTQAARRGNVAALGYLLGEAGVQVTAVDVASAAAGEGRLAALRVLHARGCSIEPRGAITAAARGGHLAVVTWLVETLGISAEDLAAWGVFNSSAESGNRRLLAWLWDRGCCGSPGTFESAVQGGCEAALVSLVQHGCQMPEDGKVFKTAAAKGDLAMVRSLRSLGCPWGSTKTFTDCVGSDEEERPGSVRLPVLKCMVEEGCPVDCRQAVEAACHHRQPEDIEGTVEEDWEDKDGWD